MPEDLGIAPPAANARVHDPVAIVRASCPGASVTRHPFAYATSYCIEELEVTWPDNTRSNLVAKHLGQNALSAQARRVKSPKLVSTGREITVYRDLLATCDLGTPVFVGGSYDERDGVLVLERVGGAPLTEIGAPSAWIAAATWLARMHAHLADVALGPIAAAPELLIRYEEPLLDDQARRGLDSAKRRCLGSSEDRKALHRLLDRALESFRARPRTVVHGDLFPSNVLVEGNRVAVVDWELAGIGPPLRDLAALVSGQWSDVQRRELTQAYRDHASSTGRVEDPERFDTDLDLARLHLAVCWLGGAPGWLPPLEHRHDWFGEAIQLAQRIDRTPG